MFGAVPKSTIRLNAKPFVPIVIVGSGFTGTETIGELRDWRDTLAKQYKLDPNEIQFSLMEMAPTIAEYARSFRRGQKTERYMEKRGIRVMKNTGVVGVHADHVDLKTAPRSPTCTLVWTAGVKTTDQAKDFGLKQGRASRILVKNNMESQDDPSIYVVGDVSLVDQDGTGKGQPQIVQGAGGNCPHRVDE